MYCILFCFIFLSISQARFFLRRFPSKIRYGIFICRRLRCLFGGLPLVSIKFGKFGQVQPAQNDAKSCRIRPRLHYDATANTPLKIYYVSSIETILCLHYNVRSGLLWPTNYGIILCLHYNGVVCRSVLTAEINFVKNSLRFLVLCLHYNGVVFRSVLTTDHYVWHSGCKSLRYGKFAVAS